nr:MAG TPA: hypothetical protein [Caudoviricetes sp.]
MKNLLTFLTIFMITLTFSWFLIPHCALRGALSNSIQKEFNSFITGMDSHFH